MKDPILFSPEQLIPSTKLIRNFPDALEKIKSGPLFITRNHDIKAVLLSLEEYRKLLGGQEDGK